MAAPYKKKKTFRNIDLFDNTEEKLNHLFKWPKGAKS